MILFIIPHAGGSVVSYAQWVKNIGGLGVTVVPLELPGHMMRSSEEQTTDEKLAVQDLLCTIEKWLNNTHEDYIIFGHSMGAALAYKVVVELGRTGQKMPKKVFFSGRWAPYYEKEDRVDLSDLDKFSEQMIEFGGIDQVVVNNPKLFDYFIRILWTDFKLVKNLCKDKNIYKIDTDVVIVYGKFDTSMNLSDLESWKLVSSKDIVFEEIDGNHFYPIECVEATINVVKKYLL